jgi:hypothetical protein
MSGATDSDPLQLHQYVELIDEFLGGSLEPEEFSQRYLRAQKKDDVIRGDPWYDILADLFAACDAYVDDPRLRDGPDALDEAALTEASRTARARLAALDV